MSKNGWTTADLPRFDGRTVLITGANSGLGLETTRALAAAGARVVVAVRDEDKGNRAVAGLQGEIEVRRLDLADLASVRAFAEAWDEDLAVLINNAGIMAVPQGTTADGFESQLGTNHLGHFALTNLLLPHVTDRVVTVASGAHRMGRIDLDDLNWERREYEPWKAYGQSKLANLLFTLELDRRLRVARSPVRALSAHPGYASTNLQSHTGNRIQHLGMKVANRVVAQSDAAGALPSLFVASVDLPGGSYAGPDGFQEGRGTPVLVGRSGRASDPATAKALWTASEELTGVSFPTLATAA